MHSASFAAIAIVIAVHGVSAQKPKPPQVITLSGCVERDAKSPNQFTIVDATAKRKFRLTGADFREYLGRRVQLDGGIAVKGLKIAGGLQPTPNIAGQRSSMDPGRAAVQAQVAAGSTGTEATVQEFKVSAIRPTGGTCE